jgi:hypothetical protein
LIFCCNRKLINLFTKLFQNKNINLMSRIFKTLKSGMRFLAIVIMILFLINFRTMAAGISGTVFGSGSPISGATVTLYAAGTGASVQLAQNTTDNNGAFKFNANNSGDAVLYLIAKGGKITGAVNQTNENSLTLMSLLGSQSPSNITVNELTTVASAFTAARFINGETISGHSLGLKIAAGNTPNLVDPVTGGWGKVLLDPLNSSQNTTLVKLNTLSCLISAYGTVADDNWRSRFLKASTPIGSSCEDTADGNSK